MNINLETPAELRVELGRIVDMLRVINTAALTSEAGHGGRAERGGMPVARLWATAYRMKKQGYLEKTKDCLPLEPQPFHETLRILVELGYYDAYAGLAEGPMKKRRPYSFEDCDVRQAPNRRDPWHVVSRDKRAMSPACFPVQCPNEAVMALFRGRLGENLIDTAIHEHIRATFDLSQSEQVFRAFRTLAHTHNRLREEGRNRREDGRTRISLPALLGEFGSDLREEDPMEPRRAEQLARAFVVIALCIGILWRDRQSYDHLVLATPCDYQWLLSTLFGLQTGMGELNRVFFGGILLPGASQIPDQGDGQEPRRERELISSLAAMVQGESGSGKTTFACHLGFDVVRYGGVCLYLALEQWPNDLQRSFYGFGWLPERGLFDYLGPSSIAPPTMEENEPDEYSESFYEARYFQAFRERVEQNHRARKGLFGLMPIRPKNWEQLEKWIESFLAIGALRNYPISVLVLDPFNAFVARADRSASSDRALIGDAITTVGPGRGVRAATGELFEAAKASNVNVLMVCEGEHPDREIAHVANTSDLVFALHRGDAGFLEPGVTEAGFHAWSRHLSVRKSRFQRTLPGHHRLKITENGISIDLSPQAFVRRLEGNMPPRRLDLPLSSGFPDLDYVLRGDSTREGALRRHSFTVYMGPAGCAKSELATLFLLAPVASAPILRRTGGRESGGQRSLLVTFRDDWASVASVLRGPIGDYLGIRNVNQIKDSLTLVQLPVGFISASEILARLQKVFDEHTRLGEGFGRVVFDNLAYMELMSPLLKSEPYFIHGLMTLLRQKGVSVLFVTSSMEGLQKSTLQARIRDGADNVVVFDRPQSGRGGVAVGATRMAVLKSVHMEHHRQWYRLSFGGKRPFREETGRLMSKLHEVLKDEDGCSEKTVKRIIDTARLETKIVQARQLARSVSFEPLVRELLAEECGKGNQPKEKAILDGVREIRRMQGFLRLESDAS